MPDEKHEPTDTQSPNSDLLALPSAEGPPILRIEFARTVLADAALGFLSTVAITLIIASLAAAGIITLGLAYVLLVLAGAVVVIASFLLPLQIRPRQRISFAVIFVAMLLLVGWYETAHFEKASTAQEIAHEVAALVPGFTSNKGPLSALTNSQLRERAIALAQSLRHLEQEYFRKRDQFSYDQWRQRQGLADQEAKIAALDAENCGGLLCTTTWRKSSGTSIGPMYSFSERSYTRD